MTDFCWNWDPLIRGGTKIETKLKVYSNYKHYNWMYVDFSFGQSSTCDFMFSWLNTKLQFCKTICSLCSFSEPCYKLAHCQLSEGIWSQIKWGLQHAVFRQRYKWLMAYPELPACSTSLLSRPYSQPDMCILQHQMSWQLKTGKPTKKEAYTTAFQRHLFGT